MSSEYPYPVYAHSNAMKPTSSLGAKSTRTNCWSGLITHIFWPWWVRQVWQVIVGPYRLAGRLRNRIPPQYGSPWRIAELRPGNQPFARLTDALLAEAALGTEYTAGHLVFDRARRNRQLCGGGCAPRHAASSLPRAVQSP